MVVPRDVVYEKFRVPSIVKSYSRITDVEPLPHMVQIQIDSYEVFKKESLRELFDEISPISDFTGNRLEMRFTDYHFDEPKYNLEECRERDATLAAPSASPCSSRSRRRTKSRSRKSSWEISRS